MATEFKGRVIIFSIPTCRFCKRAKALLSDLAVPYHDVNVERYPERRQEAQARTGRRSVPQIFFNDKHIGGYDELKKAYDEDKLEDLLKDVMENEAPPTAPLPSLDDSEEEGEEERGEIGCEVEDDGHGGCIPDEYAALVREIRVESGLVGTQKYHLKSYKEVLVGRELVQWLGRKKGMSREEALQTGRELVQRSFIHHVTHDHDFKDDFLFYRFLGEDSRRSLNAKLTHKCSPRPATEIAAEMRKKILRLYGEHLSPDGLAVDYAAIGRSPQFEDYLQTTAELKRADVKSLSRPEKIAFFCNVYNALVIHAFVVHGPPTNIFKRLRFFYQTSYIIGGNVYSLNDIESGVLRSNRKPVAALRRPFARSDPRLEVALSVPEPRVHFALVCGARSCPPIKMYSAENVEEELDVATESFLEGENCIVDMDRREVALSMILKWYRVDFGNSNDEMLHWVQRHLGAGTKKDNLAELLAGGPYKVKFLHYDWGLNTA